MKTLSLLPFLAAPVAFVLAPVSFETAVTLLFAAGLAAIVGNDYARELRPVMVAANATANPRRERLGLAA